MGTGTVLRRSPMSAVMLGATRNPGGAERRSMAPASADARSDADRGGSSDEDELSPLSREKGEPESERDDKAGEGVTNTQSSAGSSVPLMHSPKLCWKPPPLRERRSVSTELAPRLRRGPLLVLELPTLGLPREGLRRRYRSECCDAYVRCGAVVWCGVDEDVRDWLPAHGSYEGDAEEMGWTSDVAVAARLP